MGLLSHRVQWDDSPYGWWIDDLPLHRVAVNVREIAAQPTPGLRGSNIETAAEPGVRWRAKVHTSRSFALSLRLKHDRIEEQDDLRQLYRIIGQHTRMLTLTRRVQVDDRVEQVTADAEPGAPMEVAPHKAGTHDDLSVDFHLPDPYWYLPERTWTVQPGGTVVRVWNPGTVRHHGNQVELVGPLTDPTLTNDSVDVDPTAASPTSVQLSYTGSIADGEVVTLDSRDMTATDSSGTSVAGNVSKSGKWWMELGPQRNELTLTVSSGTGEARVVWRPALL